MTKTEQKLMELYRRLLQDSYRSELLRQNGVLRYVSFEKRGRRFIAAYDEAQDRYCLGELFASNHIPKRNDISLRFIGFFQEYCKSVIRERKILTTSCPDYIADYFIYEQIYKDWLLQENLSVSGICASAHKQEKLTEMYQLLRQDGYRANLLLKDGQIEYVAVPIHERMVIIDYFSDPYYDLGEVGCIYGKETHGVSFFHGVTKYESTMLEQYVSQINPEPVLYLGGMEKYRELCELAESDSDDPDRVAELQEAYEHTADAAQYRMAYEAWLLEKQLKSQ